MCEVLSLGVSSYACDSELQKLSQNVFKIQLCVYSVHALNRSIFVVQYDYYDKLHKSHIRSDL